MAAARQERDKEVSGAQSRAAESARAELDRARHAAEEQVAQARRDAERDQAELRAGLEAQIAAAVDARAGLQARAEQAEARLTETRGRRLPPSKRHGPRRHGLPRPTRPG